jgi:hypothetical protein
MWFTKEQFRLCNEMRQWGLEPRFEPGDLVARGFADLGFEEFQVLPGSKLLSLTAGTVSALPSEHAGHFFWIPSVDEATYLIEKSGARCVSCTRFDQREWIVEVQRAGEIEAHRAVSLHTAVLLALHAVCRASYKES